MYGELKEKLDNLVVYLVELKMDKLVIVVYGELDFEMIVSFLGVLKVGFSYIFIDVYILKECIELILNVVKLIVVIVVYEWFELVIEVLVIMVEELIEMMIYVFWYVFVLIFVIGVSNYYIIFILGIIGVLKGV